MSRLGCTSARPIQAAPRGKALDSPLFLPFLYGSPHGPGVEGAWLGLRGRHDRGDLLAAVLEGVAFNHKTHVDALRDAFEFRGPVRVCGGGARSPEWTQLLADVLDLRVEVTDSNEAGARGAAMLAGVGTGQLTDFRQAADRWVHVIRGHDPRPSPAHAAADRHRRYLAAVQAVSVLNTTDAGFDDDDVAPGDAGLAAVSRTTEGGSQTELGPGRRTGPRQHRDR